MFGCYYTIMGWQSLSLEIMYVSMYSTVILNCLYSNIVKGYNSILFAYISTYSGSSENAFGILDLRLNSWYG